MSTLLSSDRLWTNSSARGFERRGRAALFIAVAVLVTVRPRELNFLRLLPFILPLFIIGLHQASITAKGLRTVLVPYPIALVVLWFVGSTGWSYAPILSVAESMMIICVAGAACLVGSSSSPRLVVNAILCGCLAVLVMSIAVAIISPAYGLVAGYQAGSLKGIMLDRNSLSFVLVIGLVAALSSDFCGRLGLLRKGATVAALFGGVVWTSSSTGLILAVLACLLAGTLALLRRVAQGRRGIALALAAATLSAAAYYVLGRIDDLLALVERDSTFTGRTFIWPVVEQLVHDRPYLGYGWGAVWGNEALHQRINRSVGFEVPHAHNGYLDLEVQVGLVGLVLLLVALAFVLVRGVTLFLRTESAVSTWPLLLPIVLLVYNRVETSFTAPATLFVLFVTLVALERFSCVQRHHPRTPSY